MAKTEIAMDPVESAKVAGLRYVSDTRPGIRRENRNEDFKYIDPRGEPIRDKQKLERIKALEKELQQRAATPEPRTR